RPGLENLFVQRIERPGDSGERGGTVGLELLVHQALGERRIRQPRETVVRTLVAGAPPVQLACEPLATVEADLDVEPKPPLDPRIHETGVRVDEVLVDVEALARTQLQPSLTRVGRTVVLEAHARLDGLERADQPRLVERVLREQLPREILLAGAARLQVAHGP